MRRMASAAVTFLLLTTACGDPAAPSQPPSAAPVVDPPGAAVDVEEAAWAAGAANAFGFDLLAELDPAAGNTIVSPLSAALVLTMIAAGADGETRSELEAALHADERDEDERIAAFGELVTHLTATDDAELALANALWAQVGYSLEDDYLDRVRNDFDATLEETDLGSQAAADRIDEWADEHTRGLIDEFADNLELPDPQAVLVLANATYFLGEWTTAFDPDDTRDAPFTRADSSQVEIPFLHQDEATFDHHVDPGTGLSVLRLPYGERQRFAMEVYLPAADSSLEELLDDLDADRREELLGQLAEVDGLVVALPRFELRWESVLNDALRALGVEAAWSGGFTRMSPADPFLSMVVQETYLRVDEQGTEAAAVTGGVMDESAPPAFRADRPFLFAISDTETGAVLFLGTVTDPTG